MDFQIQNLTTVDMPATDKVLHIHFLPRPREIMRRTAPKPAWCPYKSFLMVFLYSRLSSLPPTLLIQPDSKLYHGEVSERI